MLPKKTSICSADFSIMSEKEVSGNTGPPVQACLLEIEKNFEPKSIKFLNYYKGVLNFGFFFLIIPFRLKLNKETQTLYLHTNSFQKVLCGFTQLLILYDYISLYRLSSWDEKGENSMEFLTKISYIGHIAYSIAVNFAFWYKRQIFCTVFEKFQQIKFYSEKNSNLTNYTISMLSYGLCLGVFCMTITDQSLVSDLIAHGNITGYYQKLSQQAQRHYLFIEPNSPNHGPSCLLVLFVTSLRIFVLLPSLTLVPYLDFFALVIPLSLWHLMGEFRKYCKHTAGCPIAAEKIFAKYAEIKRLVRTLNAATGSLMFCVITVSLPYYAAWMGMTFFKDSYMYTHFIHMFHSCTFFIVFFLVLTAAADVNKKAIGFICWISSPENSEGISLKTMSSLLVDLNSNQIAFKGAGFFVMTYRFLGTIFGVIITYSIITIQIQISRKSQTNRISDSCFCNTTFSANVNASGIYD